MELRILVDSLGTRRKFLWMKLAPPSRRQREAIYVGTHAGLVEEVAAAPQSADGSTDGSCISQSMFTLRGRVPHSHGYKEN